MAEFSETSLKKLNDCHPDLITLFEEVVKNFDCTITDGYRGKEEQDAAFARGDSKAKFPDSNHNKKPSWAVDVVPYPIDYKDEARIIYFAGYVKGIASRLYSEGKILHKIRWGGDWKGINEPKDWDKPHYEIIE